MEEQFIVDNININQSLLDRFWTKVQINSEDDCWEWTAGKKSGGYGCFKITDITGKPRTIAASRVSLILTTKQNPNNLIACHVCGNPPCVNPDHLYWGTPKDNAKDSIQAKTFKRAKNPIKINKVNREVIRYILENKLLTGKQLALFYNVGTSTISNIKNNKYSYKNEDNDE